MQCKLNFYAISCNNGRELIAPNLTSIQTKKKNDTIERKSILNRRVNYKEFDWIAS